MGLLHPFYSKRKSPTRFLVYNELVKGIPAIFGHFLTNLTAIHSMILFACIKYVLVPVVLQNERFLFRRVCPKNCHINGAVIYFYRLLTHKYWYVYKDVRNENHQTFEQLLIESLEKFILREAQESSFESDEDGESEFESDESSSRLLLDPNESVYSLGTPLLANYRGTGKEIMEASTSGDVGSDLPTSDSGISDAERGSEWELSFIHRAKDPGVVLSIRIWRYSCKERFRVL